MKLKEAKKIANKKYGKGWIAVDKNKDIRFHSDFPTVTCDEWNTGNNVFPLFRYIGKYTGKRNWLTTVRKVK